MIVGILGGVGLALNTADSAIPPTPAISMINTTSGNVTALQYNSFVEFVEGSGITITPNYTLNEITFTALGGGGINNTISSVGTQQSVVSGQVNNDHQLKGIACGGDLICSNNSTDVTISFTETGFGSIALDDLTDVIITAPANFSILFYNGVNWIDQIFKMDSKTCAGGQFVSSIDNSTGDVTCSTPSGSGNATSLDDLSDVKITASVKDHILQSDGARYVNKLFKLDTLSTIPVDKFISSFDNSTGDWTTKTFSVNTISANGGDTFVNSIDNSTGQITTKQFSVNSIICSGSNKLSAIDNATGQGTCSTDQTGGTARESSVAIWAIDRTWTNIGATYVNVYATGVGDPMRIDTNGKSTASLIIDWTKVGSGTQKCGIISTTAANRELITFANLVSGLNTNATYDIPTNSENIIDTFVPKCKSTTAGDDPVFLTAQVLLR